MANLETNFIGITSPNPFWIASGPPSDKDYNVNRAFEADYKSILEYYFTLQQRAQFSPDAEEAKRAYLEQRDPEWQ